MHSTGELSFTFSAKFDRGFDVFRCPRDRFLDLYPYHPIKGSSTSNWKNPDTLNFEDICKIQDDNEDDENDDLTAQ